jgi:tetratricopeptide (TPR) repeat protein
VERKEWIAAEALFQMLDAREPENWYIYNQWGIMHRSKGEFDAANEKFKKALLFTDSDDEKILIYTELAGLDQKPILLGASALKAARPGDSFTASFVAYIKGLEKDIEAQLIKLSPDSKVHLALKEARWQVGTKVTVRLSSPDLIVSSPEEEFTWRGEQEIINFLVQVPLNVSERKTVLQFDVLVGGIRIAKILLNLYIDSHAIKGEPILVTTRPASTAFASFASKDHLRVMDRLAEIRKSGLDIFDQCLALHPGEMWKPRLEQEIKSRDIFLLFWSANAKKSKWVQWEWKTALKERGISGIEPHPLDPISEAKPPRALKDLHFGDPYMLVRKAYEKSP